MSMHMYVIMYEVGTLETHSWLNFTAAAELKVETNPAAAAAAAG